MTVSTFFATEAEYVYNQSNSWANAANGAGSLILETSSPVYTGAERLGATDVYMEEGFITFQTGSLPDTDTVSDAVLTLTGNSTYTPSSSTELEARAFAYGTLASGDFRTAAQLAALTLVASIAQASWSNSADNNFVSEAAFAGEVNKTGDTQLVLHEGRQTNTTDPGSGYSTSFTWQGEETSGTDDDPLLTVTHAAAGGGGNPWYAYAQM